jgi:hypothetical protein
MNHAVAALDHIQDAAVVDLVLEMSCNIERDSSTHSNNNNNNNVQPVQQQRVQDHEEIIQWPYIEIVDVIDWRQGASQTNRRVLVQQRITFNMCSTGCVLRCEPAHSQDPTRFAKLGAADSFRSTNGIYRGPNASLMCACVLTVLPETLDFRIAMFKHTCNHIA